MDQSVKISGSEIRTNSEQKWKKLILGVDYNNFHKGWLSRANKKVSDWLDRTWREQAGVFYWSQPERRWRLVFLSRGVLSYFILGLIVVERFLCKWRVFYLRQRPQLQLQPFILWPMQVSTSLRRATLHPPSRMLQTTSVSSISLSQCSSPSAPPFSPFSSVFYVPTTTTSALVFW